MTIYGPMFEQFAEQEAREPFIRQNSKMLKVRVDGAPVWARAGSMVAYQGEIRFENTGSGGLGKMFKKAVTGEGLSMMKCSGRGDVFLGNMAADVQVLYLENDMISVNGENVLAFSDGIQWDIHRLKSRSAAMTRDLFNVSLRGTGFVAVTTKGEPVALDVASAPTFGDADSVVLWTQGVTMDVRVDTGGMRSLIRGGTGETFQMAFGGHGHVVVQPAENMQEVQESSGSGGGGFLGGIFDG